MVYKVRRIMGYEADGRAILAKRPRMISWPVELKVGGSYYLDKHKLYRVEELLKDHRVQETGG